MPDSITLYGQLTDFAERHAGTRLSSAAYLELAGLAPGLTDRQRRDLGADIVWYQFEVGHYDGDRATQAEAAEKRDQTIAEVVRLGAASAEAIRRATEQQSLILTDARRLLMREGWAQGRYRNRAGGRDLVQAVAEPLGASSQHRLPDLVLLLHSHLPSTVHSLVAWNDAPDRSLTDVLGLLDNAARHCEGIAHA